MVTAGPNGDGCPGVLVDGCFIARGPVGVDDGRNEMASAHVVPDDGGDPVVAAGGGGPAGRGGFGEAGAFAGESVPES